MPTIRVTVPENAWTEDEEGEIARQLTGAVDRVAKDSGKGDIRPLITVRVLETATVGGAVVGRKPAAKETR